MPMQNPQLTSGGLTSLVPILAFLFIIGGVILFAWMVRPTRVAVRTMLGTWHAGRHGPILPKSTVVVAPEPGAVVIDGERSAFDLSIFGEPSSGETNEAA